MMSGFGEGSGVTIGTRLCELLGLDPGPVHAISLVCSTDKPAAVQLIVDVSDNPEFLADLTEEEQRLGGLLVSYVLVDDEEDAAVTGRRGKRPDAIQQRLRGKR